MVQGVVKRLVPIDIRVQQEFKSTLPGGRGRLPHRVLVLEPPIDNGTGHSGVKRGQQRFGVGEQDVERRCLVLLGAVDFQDALAVLAEVGLPFLGVLDFVKPALYFFGGVRGRGLSHGSIRAEAVFFTPTPQART